MDISKLHPFSIDVDQETINDLNIRLAGYRAPLEPADAGWKYGMNGAYLETLIEYWRKKFDWREQELALNSLSHYKAEIAVDGMTQSLHLVVEVATPEAPVVLMLPGWPSSFVEYRSVIDRLVHPQKYGGVEEDAMTVVAVDLPGFGLSEAPRTPLSHREMAKYLSKLMLEMLQIPQFFVQGGDWGAVVGSWLALDERHAVSGLFLTMLGLRPALQKGTAFSEAEKAWLSATKKALSSDSGYREVQSTKPTTLAVGLSDSPAAMLAWMAEKYIGWTGSQDDCHSEKFMDDILTSATLYWSSNCLPTANWIYWADRHLGDVSLDVGQRIEVPTGFSFFEQGFFPTPPTDWTKRAYNEIFRREFKSGGHFPAWINPDGFVEGLVGFVRKLR